ncbi:MAG: VTT domain-containing protein [Oscillospiraceae bacterium]
MKNKRKYFITLLVPILAWVALGLIFWKIISNISGQQIVNVLPQNLILAFFALMGLNALKSMSIFFPIVVLQMAAGLIYGKWIGLGVNIVAMAVAISLPYFLGKFGGKKMIEFLVLKFPKLAKIEAYRCDNEIMFCYILRAVNVLPHDIVSFYVGATGTHFPQYILGGLLGTFASIVFGTFFGDTLSNGFSLPALLLWLALLTVSFLTSRYLNKRQKAQALKKV